MSAPAPRARRLTSRALEPRLRALLESTLEPRALLTALEGLAAEGPLGEHTVIYGPRLYARDRRLFGPFIAQHFATYRIDGLRWAAIRWKDHAAVLDPWLEAADSHDDVELFRKLWAWKNGADRTMWRDALRLRHARAITAPARAEVRARFAHLAWGGLDEDLALELFAADAAARDFILAHVPPRPWIRKASRWTRLEAVARRAGDAELEHGLYRQLVSGEDLERDFLALARSNLDSQQLGEALDARTPSYEPRLAAVMKALLELRGADVVPYALRHVDKLSMRAGKGDVRALAELCRRRGFLDLWARVVQVAATPAEWNEAVDERLHSEAEDASVRSDLVRLAGVVSEYNAPGLGLARVRMLDDATAVRFHERFPDLLRTRWKVSLVAGWGEAYPKLVERLVALDDHALLDLLASRLATRDVRWMRKEATATLELLSAYYEGLRQDEAAFAARATAVLSQVPAFAVVGFDRVVSDNRLGRLFFLRGARALLADGRAITELLESPNVYVQLLAWRALASDDPRAPALAQDNLRLLLATLLRPLHRRTRDVALRALSRAATTPEAAARIVAKARDALTLPEAVVAREPLLALLGPILARYPEFQTARERPRIFGRVEASP